jgi:tetratricopeptide (TPR) repeat protein
MQGSARPACLLLAMGLLLNAPGVAAARETDGAEADEAVTHAEQKAAQGFDAYQAKRFAEAVALYLEAYEASPNADILYNIARIYDTKLGDRPLALNFYRRYITDPGAVADRVQLANERLVSLREAELAATRGPSEPGTPSPAPPSAAPAPPAPGWTGSELTGAILGVTGIVALGIGTGFGFAAIDETKTMRQLCDGSLCSEQRGIDAAESAEHYARISTIGFVSGGVLLALGAAFYFWPSGERSESRAQASAARFGAGLAQNRGGWSLELNGSW